MNRAQGNTRSLPDGFLHIQNFTVTKHSGMAGVVYTHILDDNQRELVQALLMERARVIEDTDGNLLFHVKHGTVRFQKAFLKAHFREVVHAFTKITQQPVIETFKGMLIHERESLTY